MPRIGRPPHVLAVVLGLVTAAGPPSAHAWRLGTGLTTAYDDNFLDYSERDLFAFQYRLNPPRFAVNTTDDLILSPYLDVEWQSHGSRPVSVIAHVVDHRYTTNTIRDHFEYRLEYTLRPVPHWRLALTGSFLPQYYLRQYSDDDVPNPYPLLPRYREGRYQQAGAGVGAEWRPARGWRTQFAYEYARRQFLGALAERDENRHTLRAGARTPKLGWLRPRLKAMAALALARGGDGDENGGPPDDPDVSTRTVGGGLDLEASLRARDPSLALLQTLDLEDRAYTTKDPTDQERFHRSVLGLELQWTLSLGLRSGWQLAASYGFERQHLTGSLTGIQEFTDAESYRRQRIALTVGWRARVGESAIEGE